MSRRDTIIVAVLINAGLLIVLFTTALKSKDAPESIVADSAKPQTPFVELAIQKETPQTPTDEVDQVLTQYSKQPLVSASSNSAPLTASSIDQKAPNAINFVDDLKAITQNGTMGEPIGEIAAHTPPSFSDSALQVVPTVSEPAPSILEVKVKKGDVLEKIARSNGTTVNEIMKANNLSNTQLRIGQVLKIPAKSGAKKTNPALVSNKAEDGAPKYYTVKNGDNPWTIAMKNHLKLEELLKLNNLNEEKARRLKPGDQLRIK